MNRIDRLFAEKKENILSIYFTAGYPELESTPDVISELVDHGVDMIEIGMPFSDPVADGPVLQRTNQQALQNGMTIKMLFRQLGGIRENIAIPLILMGYLNPVLRYGFAEFCRDCRQVGIDGVILPDLPVEEFPGRYREHMLKNGLRAVFLVTPQTPEERIRLIDQQGSGFIYLVSVSSTTGERKGFSADQVNYFRRIREMKLSLPLLIGFGISDRDTFREACNHASGAIIGSAFVKRINEGGAFIEQLK